MDTRTSTFEIRHLGPHENCRTDEALVLIDGRDRLAKFARGGENTNIGLPAEDVMGPDSKLLAGQEPHDAFVAICSCGFLECGGLIARIELQRDRVLWSDFRDGSSSSDRQRPLENATFAFDASQYEQAILGTANFRSDWQPITRQAVGIAIEGLSSVESGFWQDDYFRLRFAGCSHRNDDEVSLGAMLGTKGDSDWAMLSRVMSRQPDESSEDLAARIIAFYTSGAFLSDQLVERRGFT